MLCEMRITEIPSSVASRISLQHVRGLARAERGRRLVEDHDPLAEGDRPRAGDGLALAARQQPCCAWLENWEAAMSS